MKFGLLPGALLAAAFLAAPALAAQQDFTVTNHSGHVIVTLNVSPSSSNRWGPDLLGREVLANDERGVNLCEVSEVEFTPSR